MRESQSESDSKPESDLDEEEAPFSKHMRAFMKLQASMQAQFERGVRAKMEATGEKRSKVIMNMDMLDTPLTPQQEAEQAELARLLRLAQLEAQLQADGGEPSDEELYRLLEEEQAEAEAAVPSPEQIKAFRKLEASLQAQFQREVQTNMQATGEKRSKVIMDMLGTPLTPQQEAQQEAEVAQLFRQALREVHLEASGVEPSDEELDRLVEEAQAKAEELDRLVEEAQAKAEELDRLVEEAQTKAKAADSADQQEAFEAFRQAVREMHLEASGVDPSDKELENQVEELVEWKELVELKELVEQASRKAELAAELEGHDEDAEELANMSAEEIEALAEEAREQFRNAMLEAVEEATDEWLLIKDQQRGEEAKARRAARREAGEEGHKLVSVNMGEVADVHEGAEGAEDGLMDHSSDEEYSDYEELTEEEEQEEGYPLHCNGPHHTTEVPRRTPRASSSVVHNALRQNTPLMHVQPNFGVSARRAVNCCANAQRMWHSCSHRSAAGSEQPV
jgi:exonuclease SbcC